MTPKPTTSPGGRRPTSADVARVAGFSRATVSFVLNDTPGQTIPDETRERVLTAARELSYQPSAAARTLRSGRSDLVVFLMPNWSTGEVVARTMDALSQELSERGLTFLVHPRAESNRRLSELWRTVTPALVITDEILEARETATLDAAGIAHLALGVDPGADAATESGQTITQAHVGRVQAEHLVARGHTRLGYAATGDPSLAQFVGPRLRGVQEVCAEHGLPAPDVRTVETRDLGRVGTGVRGPADASRDAGHPAATSSAWRDAGVTGVCAYNDEVALAVLAGARTAGVEVPGELSVVGADDIAVARLVSPPLTTVRLDPELVVPYLVDTIMAMLDRGAAPQQPPPSLAGEVVERGSVATPRA